MQQVQYHLHTILYPYQHQSHHMAICRTLEQTTLQHARQYDCIYIQQVIDYLCTHHKLNCYPKGIYVVYYVEASLVLHFWHRLTQVVLEMRPLNGCSSSSSI